MPYLIISDSEVNLGLDVDKLVKMVPHLVVHSEFMWNEDLYNIGDTIDLLRFFWTDCEALFLFR